VHDIGVTSAEPTPVLRRRADIPRGARQLEWQALLVASACLIVDVVVFVAATPGFPLPLRLGWILVIVCVDAALVLPARYSGWVALAQAIAAIGLALVLRGTSDADLDLVGGLIGAYRAGAWLRGRSAFAALGALCTGVVVSQLVADPNHGLTAVIELMKDGGIPWLVGRYTTARRAYISELRHRRENESRDAAVEVEKAVERVRTSIARDLHDVISHHVSAISVHAGAARLKLSAKPEFTDDGITGSLAEVESSTRSALSDLRRMLDILHGTPDPIGQPGLSNLDDLFDGVRRSGLATRFTVSGMPCRLPGSVDIALYRVTQEMLTNALRHGDGTVDVTLEFGRDHVTLAARNGMGPRDSEPGRLTTGRGLAGIRSRVALFGGTVSYGPDPTGQSWETTVTVSHSATPPGDT
jgi:signal transduction histidine kinase